MSHDPTAMLHVYGWRRDGGPVFLDNPRTFEDGIVTAERLLKEPHRRVIRVEGKDIRAMKVLWTSAPGQSGG